MAPFDETKPLSDPLELAHRQLKDATDRENRLNRQIAELEDAVTNYKQQVADLQRQLFEAGERTGHHLQTIANSQQRERILASLLADHVRQRQNAVTAAEAREMLARQVAGGLDPWPPGYRQQHYHAGLGGIGDCTMPRQNLLQVIYGAIRREDRDAD